MTNIQNKLFAADKRKPAAILIFLALATVPIFASAFDTALIGKFICFAIVAVGIDMIWGYTGILSLGHGIFFGLGAYCMAMYMTLDSSGGKIPDFMVWSGVQELPWLWKPFANPAFALAMVVVVPVALALLIGFFTFRSRIKGVYFSIISQALALIIPLLITGSQTITGGSNGLTNFRTLFGVNLNDDVTQISLFYASLVVLAAIFFLCLFITKRRTGKVLVAIRDGENRARFTGYNPTVYKLFVYALSAGIAGVAGALYVTQNGMISPSEMGVVPSIEMVIWVAIGGKGTLIGAVIGALLINLLKFNISAAFPDMWTYFIGIVFIVVILFLPKGLIGVLTSLVNRFKTGRNNRRAVGVSKP